MEKKQSFKQFIDKKYPRQKLAIVAPNAGLTVETTKTLRKAPDIKALDIAEALKEFRIRKLHNGMVISKLAGPSCDTCTWVRFAAPLIDGLIRDACVIVRNLPTIEVPRLRQELPWLSRCSSDPHLVEVIDSGGDVDVRELTERMISDAAGGHRLSPETVHWYRGHRSRQVKSKKRGRPRGSAVEPDPHKH
jgi:hypothetical protein